MTNVRPDTSPLTITAPIALSSHNSNGRTEFRARLVKAGRIKAAGDRPGRFIVTTEAIMNAIDRRLFDSLAVFADHPAWFENASVKALVGTTLNSEYNPATDSADATIRFYNKGDDEGDGRLADVLADTLAMIFDDQEEGLPPPDIGISLTFWPIWKPAKPGEARQYPLILESFRVIDSADIVFGPAADGRILEVLSTYAQLQGGNPIMSEPKPIYETAAKVEDGEKKSELTHVHPDPAETVDNLTAWRDAAGQEAARAIITHSQLPDVSKERLSEKVFNTPDEVFKAIEQEREYLATLTQQSVIQLYGGPPRGSGISGMKTGLDEVENAVNWMFGTPEATTPDPQLRRLDLIYTMLTGDYDFHGVFRGDRVFLAGADTGTLANMAANAMNKVVMAQLSLLTHYRWYETIARPTPNDGSLHAMAWTSFGGISTLPVVTEGGAYDELDTDDVKESDSFVKYGGYVGITREMIKNSDIQRIQAVPRALAAASVKTRSSKIAAIFTANSGQGPVLDQDSNELFKTNNVHVNYATTALGPSMTAWRAAATECFKQTEINSDDRIGIFPKYCLVPPDLYHVALANFGYSEGMPTTYLPEAHDRGIGDPRPVPIAVPHFTDATNWYYIADPNVWPVVHMSFSADPSGRTFPAPELYSAISETGGLLFASDVLPIKIRDEFAYGVNGYKGIGGRVVAG